MVKKLGTFLRRSSRTKELPVFLQQYEVLGGNYNLLKSETFSNLQVKYYICFSVKRSLLL